MNTASAESGSALPKLTIPRILIGQKALVTDANSGIGRGVAIALGAAGADVAVNFFIGEQAANAIVDEIQRAGAHAIALKPDVSSEDQVTLMFKRVSRNSEASTSSSPMLGCSATRRFPT